MREFSNGDHPEVRKVVEKEKEQNNDVDTVCLG